MTPLVWMVMGALGTCALAMAWTPDRDRAALVAGMAGPLAAVAGTWIAVIRTHRRNPGAVSPLMFRAFAVKVVFFIAYVAVAIDVLHLDAVPFVASFTAYFIVLYFVEALLFARLFAAGLRPIR